MTEAEYDGKPGVRRSDLWAMRKSPKHYKDAIENPKPDTQAFRMGRAVHTAILQPDEFNGQYALMPDIDKRTKAGKELYERFLSENAGKEPISKEDYDDICGMHAAVWNDPDASKLLEGCKTETPIFWTDETTGIECKCRLDAWKVTGKNRITVVDLKTCSDASTDQFLKDALRYGYDLQAAHYLRGVRSEHPGFVTDWYFVAVEKKRPWAVNTIHAPDTFIDRGTWQLISLMDKLKECLDKDEWPGYGRNELVLPEWALIPDDDE